MFVKRMIGFTMASTLTLMIFSSGFLTNSTGNSNKGDAYAYSYTYSTASYYDNDEEQVFSDLKKTAEGLGITVADTDNLIDIYQKIADAKELQQLKELQDKAKELGIDITGLSMEEAKGKLLKDVSNAKSNDPKVVTAQKTVIQALMDKSITKEDEKKYKDSLKKLADELDIDISELTVKETVAKIKKNLGTYDVSEVTNSFSLKSILDASLAIRNKNKTAFMKIIQTKVFDGCLKTEISKMTYDKARNLLIAALKEHAKVDITKGTWDAVKSKLVTAIREGYKEEAKYYGVDIKGLSDADIETKLDVAKQIMQANEMIEMQKYADAYGVDVTGLSEEDGWAKIKELMMKQEEAGAQEMRKLAEYYNVDIKGLSNSEASIKVKYAAVKAEAAKVGVDISGLKLEDAWRIVKEAQQKQQPSQPNSLEVEAAKFGVDITGLTTDQAWAKVKEAIKKMEESKNVTPPPNNNPGPMPVQEPKPVPQVTSEPVQPSPSTSVPVQPSPSVPEPVPTQTP